MKNLNSKDKRTVETKLLPFLALNKDIGGTVALKRLTLWLEGYTMREIASKEGVSLAAIQQSIRPLVDNVIRFKP